MAEEPSGHSLSYADAGVDINAGNTLVRRIGDIARRTNRPEVLGSLGGFAALCRLPAGMREPVLVAGTDGVGTKLRLAMRLGSHDTIGIDLVAMCVNDLVVCGAEPLFFLDYYATGHLDVDTAAAVVSGIGRGCKAAGCALIGGETAEMPGMYDGEDYDLAGFCVGVVEHDAIIDGSAVTPGDCLIALASSGPHANGYSLIRKIIELDESDLAVTLDGHPLGALLLEPTRIYVKSVLAAVRAGGVNAIAHITGGGLFENIPRVLPCGAKAVVDLTSWQRPAVFDWLARRGGVTAREMYRTFNCGVGMLIVVTTERADTLLEILRNHGETAWIAGSIAARGDGEEAVQLTGRHP